MASVEICSLPGCNKPGIKRCSVCKAPYCAIDHQRDDWPRHRPDCKPKNAAAAAAAQNNFKVNPAFNTKLKHVLQLFKPRQTSDSAINNFCKGIEQIRNHGSDLEHGSRPYYLSRGEKDALLHAINIAKKAKWPVDELKEHENITPQTLDEQLVRLDKGELYVDCKNWALLVLGIYKTRLGGTQYNMDYFSFPLYIPNEFSRLSDSFGQVCLMLGGEECVGFTSKNGGTVLHYQKLDDMRRTCYTDLVADVTSKCEKYAQLSTRTLGESIFKEKYLGLAELSHELLTYLPFEFYNNYFYIDHMALANKQYGGKYYRKYKTCRKRRTKKHLKRLSRHYKK